jgi:hypothetical protein
MSRRRARVAAVTQLRSPGAPIPSAWIGWLVDPGTDGSPRVDFEGNDLGPLAARSAVALPPAGSRAEVLLVFEQGDPARPVVCGVLRTSTAVEASLPGRPESAQIDGARVVLDGKDEILLRCGEASITLQRNGRVVIRGVTVETRAEGTNKVRGGSVQLN